MALNNIVTIDAVTRTLRFAYQLVTSGWCQDTGALDRAGEAVEPYDSDACEWCLTGAIIRAAYPPAGFYILSEMDRQLYLRRQEDYQNLLAETLKVVEFVIGEYYPDGRQRGLRPISLLGDWNDEPLRTKDEVVDLLARAVEVSEKRLGGTE